MTTKVMKYQIKPIDFKETQKLLFDLQYETRRVSNKVIQLLWDFQNLSFTYKERYGEYLNINKTTPSPDGYTTIEGDIKGQLRQEFYKMPSHVFGSAVRKALQKWKSNKNDILKGNISIIEYKNNMPIPFTSADIKIIKNENNKYSLTLPLISQEYAKELGRRPRDIRYDFKLIVKGSSPTYIMERVLSGEYKLSDSEVTYDKRKKKWFLNLAYTFTPEKKQLDPNRIMGIDMGVNIPAMLAISDSSYYRQAVGSKEEVESFRRQIEARRRSIQRQRKWCGEGSIGHGVKTRLKPLEKLSGKIARFKDTKNHCWSRYIINEAIKNNCGAIQMEDLTGIAEENTFLKNWTYYDLQQKIKYKAEEVGIKVVIIDPYKTSSRCHKCGHIHSSKNKDDWRPKQEKFICESCGFKTNADWNAAKNIATKGIEKIIKKQMEKQDQEYKHGLKYVAN
ncbi:transposase [Bacillus smithii]|uniref:RNA-guided endonuclease InsQ/TnpB family protein n=1 Tax=Bacillus smithii TaxID=1479 RepID=UPI002E22BB50|nr:transposase [Bacillus smithii]MED4928264.1 transposase [Bacillus smithii]